jgi:hypothetical protein
MIEFSAIAASVKAGSGRVQEARIAECHLAE